MSSQPPPPDQPAAPHGPATPSPNDDPYRFGPPEWPGYAAYPPAPQYVAPRPGNGMAVAGLVLGILAAVFFWVSFFDLPFVVLGIVFSAIGLGAARRGASGRGMAIAGLTCALVGAAGATAFTIWAVTSDESCSDRYDTGSYSYELCIQQQD